jgi:dihydropteroate synthase
MHTRGLPSQWPSLAPLPDPVALVLDELRARAAAALAAGIAHQSIVLDPGFGFGKRLDENYPLLARFSELHTLGFPLLAAVSRKRFLAHTLAQTLTQTRTTSRAQLASSAAAPPPESALSPAGSDAVTLAACVAAALAGAHLVRVHEVRPAVEALAIADAILRHQP